MGGAGGGWISRHPIAFVAVLLTSLSFCFCGFVGAVGVIVGAESDDSTAADRREERRSDDGASDEAETDEPEQAVATTEAPEPTSEPEPEPPPTYLVVRVVDGDTVELGNGETVRLVGIDAPESGECGYDRATEKLVRLVERRRVTLGESDEDRDKYDRLLRYVDRGPVDAGLALIESGLAIARYDSRDGYGEHPRESEYIKADRRSPDVECAPPPKKEKQPFVAPPSNCAPGYQPCIPNYPPDLDCADTGPVTVTGPDPHGLDGDGDGVACGGD